MTPPGAIVPVARHPISIRPATMDDLPFIDSLQKVHRKQVGWMPTKALEGKIAARHVIIAEEGQGAWGKGQANAEDLSSLAPCPSPLAPAPLGYCIGHDQYFKHDDIGIIYQMNVVPAKQRGLVGAALVKAMFDRAAYGCRLFCLWCAQDIEANYFWESLGFIPLAFRAGSQKKGRVHIFWQRRIRPDDTTTPYWFPSQTASGAIREDRLVLPIPPGTSWKDVMPIVLPKESKALPDPVASRAKLVDPGLKPPTRRYAQFGPPPTTFPAPLPAAVAAPAVVPQPVVEAKPKREKKPKLKNDPKHVAAARELRDRYMEQFNANATALTSNGKYDVSRQIEQGSGAAAPRLLPAAA